MKKSIYFLIATIIILQSFYLTSCGNEETAIYFKVGESVAKADNFYQFAELDENNFLCISAVDIPNDGIGYNRIFSFSKISLPDGTVSEYTYNSDDPDEQSNIHTACGDENGNVNIILHDKLMSFSPDGEMISEIEIEKPSDANAGTVRDIYVYKDSKVLIYNNLIRTFDKNNNVTDFSVSEYIITSCEQRDKNGYYIYIISENETVQPNIKKFDVINNKIIWEFDLTHFNYVHSICYDYVNQRLLAAEQLNILAIEPEKGGESEYVCKLYNYINPDSTPYIFSGKNGAYILTGYKNKSEPAEVEVYPLIPATKTEIEAIEKSSGGGVTITVRAAREDVKLIEAAQRYEKDNDVKVVFDFYSKISNFDGKAFRENTNAELLSGSLEWDLITVYNLDYMIYANKGYFTNLYSFDDNEYFSGENFYENIIKSCETDGKLYYMPTNIQYTNLLMNKENYDRILKGAKSWEEIIEAFDKNAGENDFLFSSYLFSSFNLDNNLSNEISILTYNLMAGNTEKAQIITEIQDSLNIFNSIGNERYISKANENDNIIFYEILYTNPPALRNMDQDFSTLKVMGMPYIKKDSSHSYNLLNGIAILQQSKNQLEAYKLLKHLSTQENSYGTPTDNILRQNKLKEKTDLMAGNVDRSEAYRNNITRLSEEVDSMILDLKKQCPAFGAYSIITEEYSKLSDGTVTATQAAENIYDRFWLYYNE